MSKDVPTLLEAFARYLETVPAEQFNIDIYPPAGESCGCIAHHWHLFDRDALDRLALNGGRYDEFRKTVIDMAEQLGVYGGALNRLCIAHASEVPTPQIAAKLLRELPRA